MGKIIIQTKGSFTPQRGKAFSAMHGGHAEAVAEAIEFLTSIVLPDAIALDHKLHTEGHTPEIGFGRKAE